MADPVTLRALADRAFLDALDRLASRLSPAVGAAVREAMAILLERNRSGSVVPTREIQRVLMQTIAAAVGTAPGTTYLIADRVTDPGWQGFIGPLIRMVQGADSPLIVHTQSYLKTMDRVLGGPAMVEALGSSAVQSEWYREMATSIARQTSAALVREVTEGLRHNIREAEARAWAESLEQPELRKLVRDTGIGLTSYQRKVLDNKAARLGVSQSSKRYGQLMRQMVNQRVRLIAEHEARQTSIRTQREHWKTLVDRGIPIDGLADDAYYVSRTGEVSSGPALHVRCRCLERTTRKEDGPGYDIEWVARRVNNKPCPRCDAFDGTFKRPLSEQAAGEAVEAYA